MPRSIITWCKEKKDWKILSKDWKHVAFYWKRFRVEKHEASAIWLISRQKNSTSQSLFTKIASSKVTEFVCRKLWNKKFETQIMAQFTTKPMSIMFYFLGYFRELTLYTNETGANSTSVSARARTFSLRSIKKLMLKDHDLTWSKIMFILGVSRHLVVFFAIVSLV